MQLYICMTLSGNARSWIFIPEATMITYCKFMTSWYPLCWMLPALSNGKKNPISLSFLKLWQIFKYKCVFKSRWIAQLRKTEVTCKYPKAQEFKYSIHFFNMGPTFVKFIEIYIRSVRVSLNSQRAE